MKKHFKAWLAAAVLSGLASHAQADLVAHYKLDEPVGTTGPNSVDDAVGLNDATPKGTNVFGAPGATANTGTSTALAGVNPSGSDAPFDTRLNPLSFTVTAWARKLGAHNGGYGSVVTSRYDAGGTNQNGYIIYNNPSGVWEFWTGNGPTGVGGWQVINSGVTAPIGAWTHLAATYDHATNTKRFYINGVQLGGDQVTVVNPNYNTGFHIGSGADPGNSFFFNGNIDDVAVYDTALSAASIAGIIAGGTPAPTAPPAGVVPIINPSFEQVTFPGNAFNPSGQGMVNGWISNNLNDSANVGSQANSPTASAAPVNFDTGIDGTRILQLNSGAVRHIWQNTNHTVIDGATYELTVAIGRRQDHDDLNLGASHWQIALVYVDDGSVAASLDGLTIVGEGGSLFDYTLTYTGTVDDVGRELQVRLSNLNDQPGFNSPSMDSVRLTYTIIPEPATLGLLMGGLLVGAARRRRA